MVAPDVIEPAPFSVHKIVPFEDKAPETITDSFEQIVEVPAEIAVGKGLTFTVWIAVAVIAGVHAIVLVTVIVKVTVVPASPAAAVYVGVKVVAPAVIEPAPFSVHKIVPLEEDAPETVVDSLEQMVEVPPALAVGKGLTLTV